MRKKSATVYRGLVSGNEDYEVEIDIAHPRRSRCNCPYAEGKQIICKHKIALYLTAFPEELKRIEEEQRQYELEIEERKRKFELEMSRRKEEITKRVKTFSKEELQRLLIDKLMNDEYEACSRDFGLEDEQYR